LLADVLARDAHAEPAPLAEFQVATEREAVLRRAVRVAYQDGGMEAMELRALVSWPRAAEGAARQAMLKKTVSISNLDRHSDAHSAADAQRGHT
jgi:hypothetical protein